MPGLCRVYVMVWLICCYSYFLFVYVLYQCVCLCLVYVPVFVHTYAHAFAMPQRIGVGQMTTWRSQLSFSTMWILGLTLVFRLCSKWTFSQALLPLFFLTFIAQPGMELNSLCRQRWPSTADLPSSTSRMPRATSTHYQLPPHLMSMVPGLNPGLRAF